MLTGKTSAHPPKQPTFFVVSMRKRWGAKQPLERDRKPTVFFNDFSSAFAEAHRMAQLRPKQHYAVFECVGYITGAK